MRFQLKPRRTALVIRLILAMIWPGSSPETAAMSEAVRTEAGLVSVAPSQHRGVLTADHVGSLRPPTPRSPPPWSSEDRLFLPGRSGWRSERDRKSIALT
jgi:hypothetical protein